MTKRNRRDRKNTISIYHPDSDELVDSHEVQLHLEKGKLHKQSYLRLQHIYEVKVSSLQTLKWRNSPASKFRLSQESYVILMAKLNLKAEEYVETIMVPRVMRQRLLVVDAVARVQTPLPQARPARYQPAQYRSPFEDEPSSSQNLNHIYGQRIGGPPGRAHQANYNPARVPARNISNYGTWSQRASSSPPPSRDESSWLSTILVLGGLAGTIYYFWANWS